MKFRIIACVVVIAIMASLMNSASAEYQGNSDKWYEKSILKASDSS